jgi:uncharacterized RDD family membrane protein YckC
MTLDLQDSTTPDGKVPEHIRRLEPAGFWIRAGARLIDWGVMGAVGVVVGVLFAIVATVMETATGRPASEIISVVEHTTFISTIGSLLAAISYQSLFEGVSGSSVGKRLLGLHVISLDATPIRFHQGVKRSVAFLVDALFFGAIAWGQMKDSPERQRVGDHWAGTRVVLRRSLDAKLLPSGLQFFAALVAALQFGFLVIAMNVALEMWWWAGAR